MKKVTLIATLAATIFLSSCKKDWSCSCNTTDLSTGESVDYISGIEDNITRQQAAERCQEAAAAGSFGTVYTTCTVEP